MKAMITTLALLASASVTAAEPVTRIGAPTAPISSMVIIPPNSEIVMVSGTPVPSAGDTQVQTVAALSKIDATLKTQGMSLADVVMMHVYLVGVPSNGGKMDFPGMMAGYKQFFGTPGQPNKPSRTTVQVAALGTPETLVEIDVEAVRPH